MATTIRTSWKGSISFGLVTVPCALATAVSANDVKFNQFTSELHEVGRAATDKTTGAIIASTDVLRGWKLGDKVVLVEDAELDALAPKASKNIEIESFVHLSEIDPVYFERTMYVIPQEGGEN